MLSQAPARTEGAYCEMAPKEKPISELGAIVEQSGPLWRTQFCVKVDGVTSTKHGPLRHSRAEAASDRTFIRNASSREGVLKMLEALMSSAHPQAVDAPVVARRTCAMQVEPQQHRDLAPASVDGPGRRHSECLEHPDLPAGTKRRLK